MPYQTITLEIELRFNPLYCADSFSCQFGNVTDGITTLQITDNIVIFFFLLFNGFNASNPTTKFPTSINVEFTTTIKTELNVFINLVLFK